MVRLALASRGRSGADDGYFSWGVLPPLVCEAVGGDTRHAIRLGAALECSMTALDIIDDVQDGDAPDALWRVCGVPTAVNVGLYLLYLSQLAVFRLGQFGVPAQAIVAIGKALSMAGARACCGQQRDLDHIPGQGFDEASYLAMIGQKSGSLVEGACRAAAALGTHEPNAVEAGAQFGFNLGVALQIQNDIAGCTCESADRNDLFVGKGTLPVIFALDGMDPSARTECLLAMGASGSGGIGADPAERMRELIRWSGAIEYALTVADVYWERSLTCLKALDHPGAERLRGLVAQLRDGGKPG